MEFLSGISGISTAGINASHHPSKTFRLSSDGTAATRQKSCNTCVRGKRRCDKRMPRCTRCAAKNLDCVYRRQPPQKAAQPLAVAPTTSSSISGGSTPEMFGFDNVGFDMGDLSSDTSPESLHQQDIGLQFDDSSVLSFSITDFLSNDSSEALGCGLPLWNPRDSIAPNKMQAPSVLELLEPIQPPTRDLTLLHGCERIHVDLDVEQVHDPRSKLGWVVREFSGLHALFAQKRCTSFMHPRLYAAQLPKTILIAFSAASSYANRTPETKGWAILMIQYAIKEIYREGEKATTPAEKLARVQALLIINSIRIFDGDVGLRAAAERELSIMGAWAKDLITLRLEFENGLPAAASMTKESPPKSWESWIILESTRRTTIITFVVICLLYLLRDGEPPANVWQEKESFTASRHLWEAQSSVEFFRAWREQPQYCITNMGFKEFWKHARPEDLDHFTRIMLTPQVGVDALDHFMMGEMEIPV